MIYIHVPFCHCKCTYCAFYSKPVGMQWQPSLYVDALLAEIEYRRDEQAHPIQTVYFGGGTPSILPVGELARIVGGLRRSFDLSALKEATIECNPEDLTVDYLAALRDMLFFNRISIGIQSLNDDVLRTIGRRHTAVQAIKAVENVRAAGFDNVSVDFIYGIVPGLGFEVPDSLLSMVSHVSAYSLTVEPGTALERQVEQGRVVLPDDEETVRQYYAVHERLEAAGFKQYEISNYARHGFRSQHNSRYWNRTPYLGLGPAAHSFDGAVRRWNTSSVEAYMSNPTGSFDSERLTHADAYNELLMTALRTTDGLSVSDVTVAERERLQSQMQQFIDCGWIEVASGRYSPTPDGLLHADGIAAALFV